MFTARVAVRIVVDRNRPLSIKLQDRFNISLKQMLVNTEKRCSKGVFYRLSLGIYVQRLYNINAHFTDLVQRFSSGDGRKKLRCLQATDVSTKACVM
jgi:hypothetical protein